MSTREIILTALAGVPSDTQEKFLTYHKCNLQVWEWFEKFALEAALSGKRLGAKAVAERVRWEAAIERKDHEFKLNNNFVAYYARIFCAKYAAYKGYFEFRETSGLQN